MTDPEPVVSPEEALKSAIRTFTVDVPEGEPLNRAQTAWSKLNDELEEFVRLEPRALAVGAQVIKHVDDLGDALNEDVAALRTEAERYFGGDFRRPTPSGPTRVAVQPLRVTPDLVERLLSVFDLARDGYTGRSAYCAGIGAVLAELAATAPGSLAVEVGRHEEETGVYCGDYNQYRETGWACNYCGSMSRDRGELCDQPTCVGRALVAAGASTRPPSPILSPRPA